MKKINILIVDNHQLFSKSWSLILNQDSRFEVIGDCGTAQEAIEMAGEKPPNIILMDINMTPISGIEATPLILKISPFTKIIGVSMHTHPAYAVKMIQAGAMGYITKNSSKEDMITAILEVDSGKKYLCGQIKNSMCGQVSETDSAISKINGLTMREIQIVEFIKAGLTSRDMAAKLDISVGTVEVHRHNIFIKLKVKNSTSLVHLIDPKSHFN